MIEQIDWAKELKASLEKEPIMLLEDHSIKKPYSVSFEGIDPKKKDVFSFKTIKKAERLMECARELVVGELFKYKEHLKELDAEKKDNDLDKYLEL